MAKSIHHKFFFPHAPEQVWEYLTRSELMAQWLMPNDFLPVLGYDFKFQMKPLPQFDSDGIVYCKVLEIKPHKLLSYSWKTGPGNGSISLDSLVVWELHPKDNGTELILNHSGFKEIENAAIYPAMNKGWLENIEKIAKQLNG